MTDAQSKYAALVREAKRMKADGLSYHQIAYELSCQGYSSRKTGGPVTAGAIQKLFSQIRLGRYRPRGKVKAKEVVKTTKSTREFVTWVVSAKRMKAAKKADLILSYFAN